MITFHEKIAITIFSQVHASVIIFFVFLLTVKRRKKYIKKIPLCLLVLPDNFLLFLNKNGKTAKIYYIFF